jgi:hypothetical protein
MRWLRHIQTNVSKETGDGDKARNILCTYPAPNAQWSRSIGLGGLLDSAHVNLSYQEALGFESKSIVSIS